MTSKTKITFGLIVLVAIILIFIITAPFRNAEAPIVSETPKSENSYSAIDHTFVKDDTETTTTSIHITKPQITGLTNETVSDAVNEQIDTLFADVKKAFLAETAGVETFSAETKHQLTMVGSAPFVSSDKVFYVDVEIYSYYSGAAHPLTQRVVLNFVRETGQLIRLEDILKKDNGASATGVAKDDDFETALAQIEILAKSRVLDRMTKIIETSGANGNDSRAADSFEETGLAPRLENYGVFYIHKDKIEWVFGQYQVAPYVFGEIKISIPMGELSSVLAPRAYLK